MARRSWCVYTDLGLAVPAAATCDKRVAPSQRVSHALGCLTPAFLYKSRPLATRQDLKALKRRRFKYRDSAYMLEPQSKFVMGWSLFLVLLIAFTAVVTPYEVSFLDLDEFDRLFWVLVAVDVSFFVDMVVVCNTVVYDEQKQRSISSRLQVFNLYLQSFFLIDLISIFPFDQVVQEATPIGREQLQVLRAIRLTRLFKLLRIMRLSRIFTRLESRLSFRYGVVKLWKNLLTVLFVCHWMACAFHLLAVLSKNPCNWINGYFGDHHPCEVPSPYPNREERYVAALYLSTYTVATVGYGEVASTNTVERIFLIIAMIVGGGLFAYVVGNICDVLLSLSVRDNEFQALMDTANVFIQESNLTFDLSMRVRGFLRNRRLTRTQAEMSEFMSNLSPALRAEVALELNRDRLKHVSFFDGAPKEMLVQLSLMMQLEFYAALESVMSASEPAESMFIIKNGLMSVRGVVRGKDDVVGEDMMYRTQGYRGYTATTLKFTELLRLHRDDLLHVLHDFPEAAAAIRRKMVGSIAREKVIEFYSIWQRVRALLPPELEDLSSGHQLARTHGGPRSGRSAFFNVALIIGHRSANVQHVARFLTEVRKKETACPFPVTLLAITLSSYLCETTAHGVATRIQRAWRDWRRRVRLREEAQVRNAQRRAELEAQRRAEEAERQRELDSPPVLGLLGTERVVLVYGPAPLAAEQLRVAVEQLRASVEALQEWQRSVDAGVPLNVRRHSTTKSSSTLTKVVRTDSRTHAGP